MFVAYEGKNEKAEISMAVFGGDYLYKMLLGIVMKDGREICGYVDCNAGRVKLDGYGFTAGEINELNERYNEAIWEARGDWKAVVKNIKKAVA